MHCPRCENVTLDEMDRAGVTVDRCPECRGVWLDRGELEKILAREARESEEFRPDSHGKGGDRPRRRKSWFENIADLVGG